MVVHIGGAGAGLATNIHATALAAKTYGYGSPLVSQCYIYRLLS